MDSSVSDIVGKEYRLRLLVFKLTVDIIFKENKGNEI